MATVQSIIDRVTHITKDYDHVRWTLAELSLWLNEAAGMIAEINPRASSQYVTLSLAAGSRQNLTLIDSSKRWIRLIELVCNVNDDAPTGKTIRLISRPALDTAFRSWRGRAPTAREVEEYAQDERERLTFDVVPPVLAGTKVYALAAVKPAACMVLNGDGTALADQNEVFPLADGYDTPAVDFVLFRCFSKDANDPTDSARAGAHLQAFQLAVGVENQDAAPQ